MKIKNKDSKNIEISLEEIIEVVSNEKKPTFYQQIKNEHPKMAKALKITGGVVLGAAAGTTGLAATCAVVPTLLSAAAGTVIIGAPAIPFFAATVVLLLVHFLV